MINLKDKVLIEKGNKHYDEFVTEEVVGLKEFQAKKKFKEIVDFYATTGCYSKEEIQGFRDDPTLLTSSPGFYTRIVLDETQETEKEE